MTIELQERIMELREAALNAREEILALRGDLSDLKRAATDREQMTFDGSLYWRERSNGKEGPFCQRCLDVESRAVRLQPNLPGFPHRWVCVACGASYQGA
jgi:hypothetical protein